MSWVPKYKYDIFLSYARVDNITVDRKDEHGWVAQFRRHLETALDKRIGRAGAVSIWRDTRAISGNELFDQSIEEAIHNSAVFLALFSNGYRVSEYCNRELRAFFTKAQSDGALVIGGFSRIFNVQLHRLSPYTWPGELEGTSGFVFHDDQDDPEPIDATSELFPNRIRPLVTALHSTLARMWQNQATPDGIESNPGSPTMNGATDVRSRSESSKHPSQVAVPPPAGLRSSVPALKASALHHQNHNRSFFRNSNSDAFPELKAHLDSHGVEKATLFQMSCINERTIIQELWHTRARIELFLSSGSKDFGVNDYQRNRIERFLLDLQNDLFSVRDSPQSGELSIYKYAAPASIRAIVMDDEILTFGPYLYRFRELPFNDGNRRALDVCGRELPLAVLRRGDPDFAPIRKMIVDLKADWKNEGVAKLVATIRHSDRRKPHRDLVDLWRR